MIDGCTSLKVTCRADKTRKRQCDAMRYRYRTTLLSRIRKNESSVSCNSVQIHGWRWGLHGFLLCRLRLRFRCTGLGALGPSSSTSTTAEEHAPHHVEERVPLPGYLDSEIRLPDLRQRVVPDPDLLDVHDIVLTQFLVHPRDAALHGEEEQADEVQQGQRRVNAHVGPCGTDGLREEAWIRAPEGGGEDQEGLVRGLEVADEEVWEDAA